MVKKLNLIKLLFFLLFLLCLTDSFAAPTDLAVKFLGKASEAVANEEIDKAYKYVNQALQMSYDDVDEKSDKFKKIVSFARVVYSRKLQALMKDYDEFELLDIKMNLDRYPKINSDELSTILDAVIEVAKTAPEGNKAERESQLKDYEIRLQELSDDRDILAESQSEFSDAFSNVLNESMKDNKRSTNIMAFAVISISGIVLIIIIIIVIICKKGFSQQQMQQEQYIHAFKIMSSKNNNILGGVTDIYGNNSPLKIKGSAVWANSSAVPDIKFDVDEEEELKSLAVKCESLGSKIDYITGRKNNAKNVSEIVYKLAMELGLSPALSMLYFCASIVYDAGFLGIDPDLMSSDIMTAEEKEALKNHVFLADQYIDFVPKKYWTVFEDAVMKHHENMDGSGYPKGLKGDEIPLIARLIHVAESYVSLSSRRVYRAASDKETALEELKKDISIYDTDVINALDKIL